jgi:hypothetical protein
MPNNDKIFINLLGIRGSMSGIKSVVLEENARLHELVELYNKNISQFPKGSLVKKKRGKQFFCYLSYREAGKVKSDYIGSVNSEKVQELEMKIEQRRKYERLRKETLERIEDMKRLVRVCC